ncbi:MULTISPECIES: hypothetical protein [unclassified Variovorax]|uniref:hypothetical protein n=1 Tax=unclassified Variovorax TaxID=663243 RepID=UPI0015C9ECFB|nr:hypothetical protein [Variovorax sp. YR752]
MSAQLQEQRQGLQWHAVRLCLLRLAQQHGKAPTTRSLHSSSQALDKERHKQFIG